MATELNALRRSIAWNCWVRTRAHCLTHIENYSKTTISVSDFLIAVASRTRLSSCYRSNPFRHGRSQDGYLSIRPVDRPRTFAVASFAT